MFHIYEDYYTEEEERIGKLMSSYWASFVTSGVPVASDDVTGDGFEVSDVHSSKQGWLHAFNLHYFIAALQLYIS